MTLGQTGSHNSISTLGLFIYPLSSRRALPTFSSLTAVQITTSPPHLLLSHCSTDHDEPSPPSPLSLQYGSGGDNVLHRCRLKAEGCWALPRPRGWGIAGATATATAAAAGPLASTRAHSRSDCRAVRRREAAVFMRHGPRAVQTRLTSPTLVTHVWVSLGRSERERERERERILFYLQGL